MATARHDRTARTASLYDTDFHRWTRQQARALRTADASSIDWDNVAEEIESLGRRDRRPVASAMEVLLAHLLKYVVQPQRHSRSWDLTVREQRSRIAELVRRNPSLRTLPADSFSDAYVHAVRLASRDTGPPETRFPADVPFTFEDTLDPDFLPAPGEPES